MKTNNPLKTALERMPDELVYLQTMTQRAFKANPQLLPDDAIDVTPVGVRLDLSFAGNIPAPVRKMYNRPVTWFAGIDIGDEDRQPIFTPANAIDPLDCNHVLVLEWSIVNKHDERLLIDPCGIYVYRQAFPWTFAIRNWLRRQMSMGTPFTSQPKERWNGFDLQFCPQLCSTNVLWNSFIVHTPSEIDQLMELTLKTLTWVDDRYLRNKLKQMTDMHTTMAPFFNMFGEQILDMAAYAAFHYVPTVHLIFQPEN